MDQDELLTECERFRTHETLDQFHGHLKQLVDQLGFKDYLYGVLPNRVDLLEGEDFSYVSHSTFEPTWMEYYRDKGYAQQDYLVRYCLRPDAHICIWQSAEPHMNPVQRRVYREALEAGCTNALTMAIKNHSGVTAAFSFTTDGNKKELSQLLRHRQRALEMITNAFNEAILDHFFDHYTRPWKPRLTEREIEVLQWLAGGYSNEQIADKLLISFPTVRKHINSAKQKLHARNSVAACVMALKWGLIR